jgi:hypothetical protein
MPISSGSDRAAAGTATDELGREVGDGQDGAAPAVMIAVHPNWFLHCGGARNVASQRITAPLEPFLRNGGIIAKKLNDADLSDLIGCAVARMQGRLRCPSGHFSTQGQTTVKQRATKLRDEIAKLQDQLKQAETREAERIGRLALKAGLGDIEIADGDLVKSFEELSIRFRKATGAKAPTAGAPQSGTQAD